jgi:probable dihydroxyacetone kinase regulator
MLRTKDALGKVLMDQLRTKSFDKITVTSIVEECGINRQTFYYHFQDINDLCKWTFSHTLKDIISENRRQDNWQDGCLATMNYLKDNKDILNNIINSVDRRTFDLAVEKGADYIMTHVVSDSAKGMSVSEEDKLFIVKFFRCIFLGLIMDWVDGGMKEDPEKIVERLSKVIRGNIHMALERFEGDD